MYIAQEEKIEEDKNKTAFDKLSDFIELEKTDKVYRDEFLSLLDSVVEEELSELKNK